MRYSGISIAYQVGGMVGGAVTPIVATALFGATGSSTPIALYVAALSVLTLLAVFGLREGSGRSTDEGTDEGTDDEVGDRGAVRRPPG